MNGNLPTGSAQRWLIVAAAVWGCWSPSATAATTVACPGTLPATTTEREFFVTPNSDAAGAPACYLFGDGNGAAGEGSDVILAANPGLLFLEKRDMKDGHDGGLLNGALFVTQDSKSSTPAPGEVVGRFWVDATKLSGFADFIIGFTPGNGGVSPRYVSFKYFNITECTAVNPCDWVTAPKKAGDLSHATLYGVRSVVPIPAAAWLLGSGLLGLFALGRRRKSAAGS
jgi:hypothetical protein